MDTSLPAAVASYIAILLTIVLFLAEWRRREARIKKDARDSAVQSIIEVIESAARLMNRPAILRPFFFPESEFTIAMMKLSHALDRKDRAVGVWATRQALQMQGAPTDRQALAMSIRAAGYLSEWSKGERDRVWFEKEIASLGGVNARQRSPRRLLSRSAEQTAQWIFLLGTAMMAAFLGSRMSSRS